jgi:hypothetical protein
LLIPTSCGCGTRPDSAAVVKEGLLDIGCPPKRNHLCVVSIKHSLSHLRLFSGCSDICWGLSYCSHASAVRLAASEVHSALATSSNYSSSTPSHPSHKELRTSSTLPVHDFVFSRSKSLSPLSADNYRCCVHHSSQAKLGARLNRNQHPPNTQTSHPSFFPPFLNHINLPNPPPPLQPWS